MKAKEFFERKDKGEIGPHPAVSGIMMAIPVMRERKNARGKFLKIEVQQAEKGSFQF